MSMQIWKLSQMFFSLYAKDFIVLKIRERFTAVGLDEYIAFHVNQFLHLHLLVHFVTYSIIQLFQLNIKVTSVEPVNKRYLNIYQDQSMHYTEYLKTKSFICKRYSIYDLST